MLETPEWTVVLYDLNDQPIMDVSKFVTLRLNLKLNDVSTCSFDINMVQFEQLCARVGATPRNVLYPQKTEVKVFRNGNALFGGIISAANSVFEVDSKEINVEADSYLQYFSKRLLTKTYTNTDRSAIAWDAINTVQSLPNGDLGVTQGTLAPIFNSDLTCDLRDVKSIIQLYTYAQPTTYDFEITPDKVFNTYTRLGSDRPEYELIYPFNIVSMGVPRSADSLYNRVIGIGSGIGEERLQTDPLTDNDSIITYRVLENKVVYSSVERIDTLNQNTAGFLAQSTDVLVLPNVSIRSSSVDLDVVRVGDSLPVKVEGSTYNDDVRGMFRIYGMNITVGENNYEDISLDFYKPDLGGGLEEL